MPEKSVREMNKYERLRYSLASRTFHTAIGGAAILGIVALVIGLGWYAYSYSSQLIKGAFGVSKNAQMIISKIIDPTDLGRDVMDLYRSVPAETRGDGDDAEYLSLYDSFKTREDYVQILSILKDFRDSSTVSDVYYAMYDEETGMLVYFADPDEDEDTVCPTGFFETATKKELNTFLRWNGKKTPYYIEKTERYGWICTTGISVKDQDGSIAGFILADVTLKEVGSGMLRFLLQYGISMFVLINLVAIFMTRHMKKKLVKPINEIAEAAEAYLKDKKDGARVTDHFSKLNINTGDEVENLALIMADMETDLADYEDDLTRVAAEKERISIELSLATRIQADMLPNIFPAFPERSEFDVFASMKPAKEVGGDFYDFFLIDEDHLGLVMADVSGKGVPAALFMMVSKILVQNIAMSGKSPAEVIKTINAQICANNREEMFVTVWFGVLDVRDGTLRAVNAGHEYPMLKKPGGDFELVKDTHGFVVGGFASSKYKEYELKLEPGAKLFLYTDGVTEASNEDSVLFGTGRTLEVLNKNKNEEPEKVVQSVNNAISEFCGSAPQFDDITLMCLEYFGKGNTEMKEITVEAKIENIPEVTDFVNGELEKLECSLKAQMQIDVAIDEMFGNIARYAYGGGAGNATVQIRAKKEPKAVELTFIDGGTPYDPLKKDDPDISLGADEREVGGLGIFLVKKTMDDMKYEYKDGQNRLTVTKLL